jgi:DNA polymerase-3 subunit alpha
VGFAYEADVPLVATNDVYFKSAETFEAHDVLLCIADGAFVGQEERRRVTPDHGFKSPGEMRALFADLPEACDNTLEIARRCAFMVAKREPLLPRFNTGGARSEDEEMAHQAREGLKARIAAGRACHAPLADYEARLEREIGVITRMGFSGYFLIVSDFIKWARRTRSRWGRGGAPGPARWSPTR